MRRLKPPAGTINIHEPLTADPGRPQEIFQKDLLDRRRLAERILSRLADTDCPCALGIYGGWGTGKTSLLNLMKQLNESPAGGNPSPIYMVSIDAWEHESGEGLLIPVVAALDELKGADVKARELAVVVKRALFASGMVVAGAMLKKYTDMELKELQDSVSEAAFHDGLAHKTILDKWKRQSGEIKETKDAFAALVDSACRKQGVDKLVVCIDNLDRCSPENAVRLLESVKVFFSVPGCVWVFAVDAEVISSYVNHKYEGTKMDGNSYLDKIIPEQYHLSLSAAMDRDRVVNLLRNAAENPGLEFNDKSIPQIPRVLVPRRLIKSARKFSDFYSLHGGGDVRVSPSALFSLSLLYHAWPGFYQRLSSSSEAHICGILDNFFPSENSQPGGDAAQSRDLLPLLKDYTADEDLAYFLKTVFAEYPRAKAALVDEIVNGMRGLRMTGLP